MASRPVLILALLLVLALLLPSAALAGVRIPVATSDDASSSVANRI